MLLQLRNVTRTWIAGFIIGLLVLAFALWGINDWLGSPTSSRIVAMGDYSITPGQLTREMDLSLRRLRANGQNLTQAEAVEAGLHTRILEDLVARRARAAYAERVGVSASDRLVAQQIREIVPTMEGLGGGVDETAYDQFLGTVRYTRPEFEREIRGEIASAIVMSAMTAGVRAPSSFGALVLAYETEQRSVSIAEAPVALTGAIPAPNEPQLQAFYEDNAAAFAVPEYRGLTLIYARPQDFVARVDIPEARLQEEFAARSSALGQPEKRTFVRLSAANEQQAQDAAARLGRGEAPAAVAQALGVQMVRYDDQTREQIADARVGAAVFAMPANAAPRAVQGQLSPWAAVQLESITPAVTPNFADERQRLHDEIASEEAAALLNEAVSGFDDARAAGASLAEAARAQGLTVVTIPAVDAQGLTPSGQPAEALVDQADIISLAFETPEGEASDFAPSADADVMVAVDSVVPATTRPLADVRPQLIAGWTSRERARLLQAIGVDVAEAVAGGQSFEQAVRAHRLNLIISDRPVDRRGVQQIPARQLGAMLFTARVGEVVSDIRADGGALLVAVVNSIERANPAEVPEAVEQARLQMQQTLGQSLDEAITAEAIKVIEPRRNEALLRRTFSAGSGEGDAPPAP